MMARSIVVSDASHPFASPVRVAGARTSADRCMPSASSDAMLRSISGDCQAIRSADRRLQPAL